MNTLTLAAKLERIKQLLEQIEKHPMTLHFRDTPKHYVVYFPANNIGLDGVRVEKANNKIKALELLLEKLEKCWKKDNALLYR